MSNLPFAGKEIVITGKLNVPRAEAEACLVRLGATVSKSVTWRTDYLVAGARTGATKMNSARAKGVTIITEDDLDKIMLQA